MPTAKVHGFLMIFPVRTCSLAEVSCESLVNACHSTGRSAAEKILWNWELPRRITPLRRGSSRKPEEGQIFQTYNHGGQTMKHKWDYDRFRIIQIAEHISNKANSVLVILRQSLGGRSEAENVKTAVGWMDDLRDCLTDLSRRCGTLPAPEEDGDEDVLNDILAIDARLEADYKAWIAAYHADHTRRCDYLAVFRAHVRLLEILVSDASERIYSEVFRHRILLGASSLLNLSEKVVELLEFRERCGTPPDPRYETPGRSKKSGEFGSEFDPLRDRFPEAGTEEGEGA